MATSGVVPSRTPSVLSAGRNSTKGQGKWRLLCRDTTKPDRDEALRKLGYDHIVHSTDPRLPAQVRELTHGLGADAVWDCVGGNDFFQLSLSCIRLGGFGRRPHPTPSAGIPWN